MSEAETMIQPPAQSRRSTEYVLLAKQGEIGEVTAWEQVATVSAVNANEALRQYVKNQETVEGAFVAVPARSFRERTIQVENKQTVKIS